MINNYSFISFTCIEAPLSKVREAVIRILDTNFQQNGYTVYESELTLASMYINRPFNDGIRLKKALFYTSHKSNNLTIMFSNLEDGWITLSNCISSELKCKCWNFTINDETKELYPKNSFEIREAGKAIRIVYVLKDWDKWIFYEAGTHLSFENPNHYSKRMKKERLNESIIIQYCGKLGWDIQDPKFWTGK